MLPVKFLSTIIENKDKNFSSFDKINSDTILIRLNDDTDIKVYHPDLDVIKSVKLDKRFKNTIIVEINEYVFSINYGYDPVRVTKKHRDFEQYEDIEKISEIISNNEIKEIKTNFLGENITFIFSNDNKMDYQMKQTGFRLLDSKTRKDDVLLQFTSGIYSVVNHINDYHLFKLSSPNINFENKIRGLSYQDIEQKCNNLPISGCTNTVLSTNYNNKTVSYNSKDFCRIKDDNCIVRENLDQMDFSYLDFNY